MQLSFSQIVSMICEVNGHSFFCFCKSFFYSIFEYCIIFAKKHSWKYEETFGYYCFYSFLRVLRGAVHRLV